MKKHILVRNEIRRVPPGVGAALVNNLVDNIHPVDSHVDATTLALWLIHCENGTIWERPGGGSLCATGMTRPQEDGGCRALLFTTDQPWTRQEIRFMRQELREATTGLGGDFSVPNVNNPHSARWAKLLGCTEQEDGRWLLIPSR